MVALGLCNEAGERQEFTALLLGEAREVGTIRFDRAQYPDACAKVVV